MWRKKWLNVDSSLDRKKYGTNPHAAADAVQKKIEKLKKGKASPSSEKITMLERIKNKLEEALSYESYDSPYFLPKVIKRGPAEEEWFLPTSHQTRNPFARYR